MRVLLTTDTVGGVWTFCRELTVGLLERGHAVALVSVGSQLSQSQRGWVLSLEQRFGPAFRFEASDAPLEWTADNDCAYSSAEACLLRVVDDFAVDLVHSNQFCFGALPSDIPKLITAHSDVFTWAEACRPHGLEDSDWLTAYRTLVTAGIAGAAALVAPTRWMRDALSRHFLPSATAKFNVILNGRTIAAADLAQPRRLQAVTAGRLWDEAKGLSVLAGLNACIPILLAGELQFDREQAPALEGVTLLGRLDETATLQVFQTSSLYIAASIYEPFGLAPLEAALCGCGVLARDIPSLREVWGDAVAYFTNTHDLATAMASLYDSPAQLKALQHRSLQRALELSADRMVDAYLAQYQLLLSDANTREAMAVYAA